jgi:hypothetical protein
MLKVLTMLVVGDTDKAFFPEIWQHLDCHVHICWVPGKVQNCSYWCPQDW